MERCHRYLLVASSAVTSATHLCQRTVSIYFLFSCSCLEPAGLCDTVHCYGPAYRC